MKQLVKTVLITFSVLSAILCNAETRTISVSEWKAGNHSDLYAIVLRGTRHYVSGQDRIVLYSSGEFQLRSGSSVLCTGTYNVEGGEIRFTVGYAVFYGKIFGQTADPTRIQFVFDGKEYNLYLQR